MVDTRNREKTMIRKVSASNTFITPFSWISKEVKVQTIFCLSTKSSIFVKVSEEQDFEHSNIYHYKVTFKTQWIDETAKPLEYYTTGTTNLEIDNG